MELVFHWFWLIKLLFGAIVLFTVWSFYKTKKRVYLIMSIVLIVLYIINPIKFKPNTQNINNLTNVKIEQNKKLPELIKDDSFENSKKNLGIKEDDLK